MDASTDELLAAMASASLSSSGLGPVIDAKQAATLLACSQEHIEKLTECGRLPAKKYGRGWIFVTTQLLHHVIAECASNVRAPEATQAQDPIVVSLSRSHSPVSSQTHSPLEPLGPPRKRGRPRRQHPEIDS
jgi:excisionase family DNA binding protein